MGIETIYLLLLFVGPGMFIKLLHSYLKKEKPSKQPVYEYMFWIVVDSVIVVSITAMILKCLAGWKMETVTELIEELMMFSSLAGFLVIAIVVCLGWYLMKYKMLKPSLLYLKNRYLEKTEHINHFEEPRVWEYLQNQEGVFNTWKVVSIYKDGTYIMSGMIEASSHPQNEEFELALIHNQKVEILKAEHPELFKDWYDYYNATTGVRVKFYKQKEIQERWQEYYQEDTTS